MDTFNFSCLFFSFLSNRWHILVLENETKHPLHITQAAIFVLRRVRVLGRVCEFTRSKLLLPSKLRRQSFEIPAPQHLRLGNRYV